MQCYSSCISNIGKQMLCLVLLNAASVATFGVGSELVTDRCYCDANKLDPDQFLPDLSFAT